MGEIRRIYVDIKNLEKIDSDMVGAPLMWDQAVFDSQMCFRDTESLEIFVFDKNGVWN